MCIRDRDDAGHGGIKAGHVGQEKEQEKGHDGGGDGGADISRAERQFGDERDLFGCFSRRTHDEFLQQMESGFAAPMGGWGQTMDWGSLLQIDTQGNLGLYAVLDALRHVCYTKISQQE